MRGASSVFSVVIRLLISGLVISPERSSVTP